MLTTFKASSLWIVLRDAGLPVVDGIGGPGNSALFTIKPMDSVSLNKIIAEVERTQPVQLVEVVSLDHLGNKIHGNGLVNMMVLQFAPAAPDATIVGRFAHRVVHDVMSEGAKKYGDWGWQSRTNLDDCIQHAKDHLDAMMQDDEGRTDDDEDHLAHAACRLIMALYLRNIGNE